MLTTHDRASPTPAAADPAPGGCARAVQRIDWRRAAASAVKLAHSLIFLSLAASVVQIYIAGLSGRASRWTRHAYALTLGESLIFAANGCRCPLRQLAEALGAESGQVTDIFLPRWVANRIHWIFTPLLLTGLLATLRRRLREASPDPGRTDPQPQTLSAVPLALRRAGERLSSRDGIRR